ncbi:GNAT family N-acetyltransferase [Nigerium massiliense]|uniref:GNAT family N-acetyltransferase n=1 Tax=Nigerium massiliense TaxID=1522317 RepID=UPI00058CA151|nr:GNAT family N-acetyltransferase [Nigerium massiliense]
MQAFIVRRAVPDDADAVTDLWVRSWLDTYVSPEHGVTEDYLATIMTRRSSRAGREHLRQQLSSGDTRRQAMFVAEADGLIVGMAAPRVEEDGTQRVGALYVSKAWHGRGPGNALMSEVLAWRDPSRPLLLEVAVYNARAIAFYRRWGFVALPGASVMSGVIPTVRMELPARRQPGHPRRSAGRGTGPSGPPMPGKRRPRG